MSNITPQKPSFVFGYWRPWKEDSNLFDSYLNYVKDVSLVKYGADTVGEYVIQASQEQVQAINHLGKAIGRGINVLKNQMEDINQTLTFLNRNMDIQIEQQRLSNLLLQNIAELLRVPDSEKERQHCIELGVKFFVNASKDADLFMDALEEFLKAESLMKQDYFVLHRIGCIYMYVEKYINPEKALDYFIRAGKYASVESGSGATCLVNALTNNFNTPNSKLNSEVHVGSLAADSYEKAAFAAYVLGKFSEAVNYQSRASKLKDTTQNRFLLAKYQVRNDEISGGIKNLSKCIDDEPIYLLACFKEIDLCNEPEVVKLITEKNSLIDSKINHLLEKWKAEGRIVNELLELLSKSYELKVAELKYFEIIDFQECRVRIDEIKSQIDELILKIRESTEVRRFGQVLTALEVESIICELTKSRSKGNLDQMLRVFDTFRQIEFVVNSIKVGSKFAGGIVFYIDETGEHGLVVADKNMGEAVWGQKGGEITYYKPRFGGLSSEIADGSGSIKTSKIVENFSWTVKKSFFSTSQILLDTAARVCQDSRHNGQIGWYLPTIGELKLIYEMFKITGLGLFHLASAWSCDDRSVDEAFYLSFINGEVKSCPKDRKLRVVAVRRF